MENNNTPEKKPKSSRQTQSVSLNIRRETKKRIQAELVRVNKKDYGRSVSADDFIAMAIGVFFITYRLKKSPFRYRDSG